MTEPAIRLRPDLALVADMVPADARVLDIGCEAGDLLAHLAAVKRVDGRGLELEQSGVARCVARGLSVIQGDANTDLAFYPSDAYDYVILTQTLPAMRAPRDTLAELVRIGRRAIVSLPNFGHWQVRAALAFGGRMPRADAIPHRWFDTPNIHLCTIADFIELADELGLTIEDAAILDRAGRRMRVDPRGRRANLFGEQAIFLLARGAKMLF